jgi:ABC-2 type transport system ATP-binding protein
MSTEAGTVPIAAAAQDSEPIARAPETSPPEASPPDSPTPDGATLDSATSDSATSDSTTPETVAPDPTDPYSTAPHSEQPGASAFLRIARLKAGLAKNAMVGAARSTIAQARVAQARLVEARLAREKITQASLEQAKLAQAEMGLAQTELAQSLAAPSSTMLDSTVPVFADIVAPAPALPPAIADRDVVLVVSGLKKHFGDIAAVDNVSLAVPAGTIFGIVGPNGAGKTTTLSMVTGLLRPDGGSVFVHGADVWKNPAVAKRNMGVLPDRLRLFDQLTGSQMLHYAGTLRGLDARTVKQRSTDLAAAFGLADALGRLVSDYSAGMTKKIALACAMIHSPRLLVLDEPFESVDPVSAANVTAILQRYVAAGGTVVLSSHSMELVQRVCDLVAIVVSGKVLASGTVEEVSGAGSLEERFLELAGGGKTAEGMEWLHSFSD